MMTESREEILEDLKTLRDYVRFAVSRFSEANIYFGHGTSGALDEAAALVLFALHLPYDLPGGYFEAVLTRDERRRVFDWINRRITERKPLAYLTREAPFAGHNFYVDERVLVPRSPIAELIEVGFVPWVNPDNIVRILDLCTGSGCIGLSCALSFPDAEVDLVDISGDALSVAEINCSKLELMERVRLIKSDLFEGIKGQRYDIIVSNPPYVSQSEWEALPEEFHAEPRIGLESGVDGLDCVRRILEGAADHLNPEGILVVEVGSAAEALVNAYPHVSFCWLDFERGGDGVFLLTAQQLKTL